MIKCWYHLNVSTDNFLRKDWEWAVLPKEMSIRDEHSPENVLNPEWREYTTGLGLEITDMMMFNRPPNHRDVTAHIDVRGSGQRVVRGTDYQKDVVIFALNVVLGGKGSEMIWYNLPPGPKAVFYTAAGTPYVSWPIPFLTEIDRCAIDTRLTMVKIDQPHAIAVAAEPRLCISLRMSNIQFASWDEGVEYMRSKNLLIER